MYFLSQPVSTPLHFFVDLLDPTMATLKMRVVDNFLNKTRTRIDNAVCLDSFLEDIETPVLNNRLEKIAS